MSTLDTSTLVADLRHRGAELTHVEVKAATGGCPKSLRETLSAFSNLAGGTVLLGLADDTFDPVPIDAFALRDAVAGMASNDLEPPVRAEVEIEVVEGHKVVRIEVPELDASEKPCYVKSRGRYGGSYTRSGDGDRKLSNYEIDRLLENRGQPEFDRQLVEEASLDDLDELLLEAYVTRVVEDRPNAFKGLDRVGVLRRLAIVKQGAGELKPTLAAVLTFGKFPQEFFPQLCISVVVLPRLVMGQAGPSGERFLDSHTCDGPLPLMLADAISRVTRNMTRASVMSGSGRSDRLEYPIEVVRELIANAAIHRDYSPGARGTQIQVELYPDRMVVRSPGGFFGAVDPANFGDPDVSSSRNAILARLLADTPMPNSKEMVAENRGSGIPTVLQSLNAAGMAPPVFSGDFRKVEVTVPHDALLTPDTTVWVHSLKQDDLTQAQVQALALMRSGRSVRNQILRGWGLHPADATRDLSDLVRRGLAHKIGDKRGATYKLAVSPEVAAIDHVDDPIAVSLTRRQEAILRDVRELGEATARELVDRADLSYGTVIADVNELLGLGLLEATAPPRSRHRKYVLALNVEGGALVPEE